MGRNNKWLATCYNPKTKKPNQIGTYESEVDAAKAVNEKCRELNIPVKNSSVETYLCPKGHTLQHSWSKNTGGECDGNQLYESCRGGCTGFDQTENWENFHCKRCDYDFCNLCVQPINSGRHDTEYVIE